MNIDLIIDGNYLMLKLVFTLHKNNLLYGALEQSLEKSLSNYKDFYFFDNTYLVSDSKESSWRQKYTEKYKKNRKKDSDIDWKFVYDTYTNFKNNLKHTKVLEAPTIEGDDWISFLVEKANSEGRSTFIISNDHDIKQLIKYSLDPLWINIMSNEMMSKEKTFIPKNYQIFIDKVKELPNDDIFNLNDNPEFLKFIDILVNKYEVTEIDHIKSLFIKLVSGDRSDNIDSVWSKEDKNGKKRGIGKKGAETLYDKYIEEYGSLNINDSDLYEDVADIICESKKISKTNIEDIAENLKNNSRLVDLEVNNLPDVIVETMKNKYQLL